MTKTLSGEHVIMVDDNEGDTYVAARCYRSSKLTNPWLSFSNGPDFLAHLAGVKAGEHPMPALVLLDINMPQMTGLEVLAHTRADPFFAHLPMFCMLTSSSDPRDQARAEELGASGFMTKPPTIREYVEFFDSLATRL